MKVRISGVTGNLPGQLIIEPETEQERFLLRIWSSWPDYTKKDVTLTQGNVWTSGKGVTSLTILWEERPVTPVIANGPKQL